METLIAKFKKSATFELLKKVEKLNGIEKEACIVVLKQRNQDVSKWEVKEEIKEKEEETMVGSIHEEEPEEELSSEDQKKLDKAIKEADKEDSVKQSNLFKEAEKKYKAIIKDNRSESFKEHEAYKKLKMILNGREYDKKLNSGFLLQIIAIALPAKKEIEEKTEKVVKEKAPKEKKESTPKVSKIVIDEETLAKFKKGTLVTFTKGEVIIEAKILRFVKATRVRIETKSGDKFNKQVKDLTLAPVE